MTTYQKITIYNKKLNDEYANFLYEYGKKLNIIYPDCFYHEKLVNNNFFVSASGNISNTMFLLEKYETSFVNDFLEKTDLNIFEKSILIIACTYLNKIYLLEILSENNFNFYILINNITNEITLLTVASTINYEMFMYFIGKDLKPEIDFFYSFTCTKDPDVVNYLIDYTDLVKNPKYLISVINHSYQFKYSNEKKRLFYCDFDVNNLLPTSIYTLLRDNIIDIKYLIGKKYNFEKNIDELIELAVSDFSNEFLDDILNLCETKPMIDIHKIGIDSINKCFEKNIEILFNYDENSMDLVESFIDKGYDIKKILASYIKNYLIQD